MQSEEDNTDKLLHLTRKQKTKKRQEKRNKQITNYIQGQHFAGKLRNCFKEKIQERKDGFSEIVVLGQNFVDKLLLGFSLFRCIFCSIVSIAKRNVGY